MHKVIGLDLDGVLYDYHIALYNELFIHDKATCSFVDFWTDHYKMYNNMWWDNMTKVDFLYSTQVPKKEDLLLLKELSKHYKIYYITSRPLEVKLTTEQYLNRYEFPQRENLIFTKDKGLICNSLGVTLMVEDQIHHIDNLYRNGVEVIIMNQLWNNNPSFPLPYECKRINNFSELRSILC